jgi:N-acetylneuraminate synthase/N,N'-diacetyllegionaminate synthase
MDDERLRIGEHPLDDPSRPFFIAEVGSNHGHDLAQARLCIQTAGEAGCQAIKFQTFTPEALASPGVPILRGHDPAHDALMDRLGVTTLRDLFRHGGLPRPWHRQLQAEAHDRGLVFLSTPFSRDDARFLVEDLGVHALKIASGDVTFTPLLDYAAQTGLPVLLSTGGATMDEVEAAVLNPLFPAFAGRRLVVLHCVSTYPCPDDATNLRAIHTMRQTFTAPIGFSDHSLSEFAPALAVTLGATVIEKHMRLDFGMSVDTGHALDPLALRRCVQHVRDAVVMLGHGRKEPHALEAHDRIWARRGADGLRPTEAAREGQWA